MKSINVEITNEALQKHASCDIYDALGQVIFNAIDSSALRVDVCFEYEEQGLNQGDLSTPEIACIRVKDNGMGIPFESAFSYFSQYNKSWKLGRTRPDGRPYQGKQGIGRFKYFSLGHNILWNTCYKKQSGDLYKYSISGSYSNPKYFSMQDEERTTDSSVGTEVVLREITDNAKQKLCAEDLLFRIAELVGLYIKSNPQFHLFVNEKMLNLDDYIDEEEKGQFVVKLDGEDYIFNYTFVVWKPDYSFVQHKHAFLFDDSFNYKSMFASGVNAADTMPYHTVLLSSNYYNNFDDYSSNFNNHSNTIKRAYREKLLHFLYKMRRKRSKERFKIFSEADYYPFANSPKNEIEAAERNLFDLCAFSILEHEQKVLDNKNCSLVLLFKLLRKLITNDASISDNLCEVLNLTEEEAAKFKNICQSTSLPALIQHYNETIKREAFLDVLDLLVHKDFYKTRLKERTQLHKIIEQETWIFGDRFDYNLSNSDQGLANVLKNNLDIQELSLSEIEDIKKSIEKDAKNANTYLKKIPDLYMWKTIPDVHAKRNLNLIVELKAPNVSIGVDLQEQAMNIYRGISKTSGVEISEKNKWEYWLVSSDISNEMKSLYQGNPAEQILQDYQNGNYRIYCRTWGQIIRDARFKLIEQRRGLEIQIQEEQKNNLLNKYLEEVNFK